MGENDWIDSFLGTLGAPINSTNVAWVQTWIAAEGPWSLSASDNNPLNIEAPGGGFDAWGSPGQGGAASAEWLMQQGYYGPIVSGLRSGNPASSPGLATALSWWSGGGGNPNNLTTSYRQLLGAGAYQGSPNSAPSGPNGWLQQGLQAIEGGENALMSAITGLPAGVFQSVENWSQTLFGGNVSPFLRLPQSLINIGWNFGGFCLGLGFVAIGGLLLFGFVFEEGFSGIGDVLGDSVGRIVDAMNAQAPGSATPQTAGEAAELAEVAA